MNGSAEETVRELARGCGFDGVGFARAEAVEPETAAKLRDWIAKGRHASMTYMERDLEKRLDPRLILPGARTVIVLTLNHYRENPTLDRKTGKIARYAGGRDYHKVIGKKLRAFRKSLTDRFPDIALWYSVDTGPILERYWAENAGLGWIGKNTNLLTKDYGSWVFVAVVLVSLDLEADSTHADHCGTCTRCLEACPTGAFIQPGLLDSKRCISYWTIEHRGEFELEIAENLNGWFFGCDDCQEVCPWNRHAKPTTERDFELSPDLLEPDLIRWAEIEREEWDRLTRGIALRRTGHPGFKRNAAALLQTRAS
jgi:epoxyqueuosine reductase